MDFGGHDIFEKRKLALKKLTEKIDRDIDTVGHSSILTQLELPAHRLPMAYSIGMSLKGPCDFVVLGLPLQYTKHVLQDLAKLCDSGELVPDFDKTYPCLDDSPMCNSAIDPGAIIYRDDIFSNYRCAILPLYALPSALGDLHSWQAYKGRNIHSKFCQVALPDTNNLFPWEGGEIQAGCPILSQVGGMPKIEVSH